MQTKVSIGLEKITGENILKIFQIFCEVYGIEKSERDEMFMKEQAINHLNSKFGLDYRPFMGAKFFGVGRITFSEFHGYNDVLEYDLYEKEQEFQRRVTEEFRE